MKRCTDCRWMRGNDVFAAKCGHADAAYVYLNPVDGSVSERQWNCGMFRVDAPGRCGRDGNLWEPKDAEPEPPPVGFV